MAAARTDLWDRRHQFIGGYSRGRKQKVAIAAALVTDPALILLDEPTIELDVAAARTVKAWVRRLAAEQGTGMVLTSHQLAVPQAVSDRVAVIHVVQRDGPPLGRPFVLRHPDAFLDSASTDVRTRPNASVAARACR